MDNNKDLLIASAARLYSMGIDLEAARDRLRQLLEQGIPYNSGEMRRAVQDFKELDRQWKGLEREHLELRDKVTKNIEETQELNPQYLNCGFSSLESLKTPKYSHHRENWYLVLRLWRCLRIKVD